MPPSDSIDPHRREFLRSALRYTALAGIAGLVASAARRANDPACTRARFCEGCLQFEGCDREQAAATRRAAHKSGGES